LTGDLVGLAKGERKKAKDLCIKPFPLTNSKVQAEDSISKNSPGF
jgi:hypothetical protein